MKIKRDFFPYFTQGKEIRIDAVKAFSIEGAALESLSVPSEPPDSLSNALNSSGACDLNVSNALNSSGACDLNVSNLRRSKAPILLMQYSIVGT